jgi:hypothetical protein
MTRCRLKDEGCDSIYSYPKQGSNDNAQIQQVETNYRLMIKKSLKSHRTEELGACEGGKEEQKALLAKWFDYTHNHYRKLLGLV